MDVSAGAGGADRGGEWETVKAFGAEPFFKELKEEGTQIIALYLSSFLSFQEYNFSFLHKLKKYGIILNRKWRN